MGSNNNTTEKHKSIRISDSVFKQIEEEEKIEKPYSKEKQDIHNKLYENKGIIKQKISDANKFFIN